MNMNIIEQFDFKGTYVSSKPFGSGIINDTYKVEFTDKTYLLQKINTNIFKKPQLLMDNVVKVTTFLKKQYEEKGEDFSRKTLNVVFTKSGHNMVEDASGIWRAYDFIDNSISYDLVENEDDFKRSGVAFGSFQKLLKDFPIDTLNDTIEDFHHTPKRFKRFLEVVAQDPVNRVSTCKEAIDFILNEKEFIPTLWDLYEAGKLSRKVTHNDTKLNNVLFDKDTSELLCIVDLDTVMPGFVLDDFGDSIRFGASTALEDEKDLEKVHFDLRLFEVYAQGYLEGSGGSLTDLEVSLFPTGAKMITLEQGIRFLTDYLEGDVYYKTEYDEHNLVRALTQLKLVSEMNDVWDEMNDIVNKLR